MTYPYPGSEIIMDKLIAAVGSLFCGSLIIYYWLIILGRRR